MPLKLKRYPKRSPHWYLRGTVRSQNVYETTGTDDAKAADDIRIKRENGILERSIFGPGADLTFAEAAVSYLEAGGEARYLGAFHQKTGKWTLLIGHFGSVQIVTIGQSEADAAAKKLLPMAGNATRKRQIYIPLCAVLNHAQRKGWGKAPKITHPKVREPVTKWATPDWMGKLLPHCAPRLRRLVLSLAYTGARLSEALRLTWEDDIHLNERTILITRTKNGKMRAAHIPDALLIELASVPVADRRGRLFLWSHKCHVYKPLRTACRRAGIPYLSPHQLGRHTFATWLRLYGKRDLKGLMEDGGWDSIASVARYAHTVPGETVTAVNSLPSVQIACNSGVQPIKDRRIRRKSA